MKIKLLSVISILSCSILFGQVPQLFGMTSSLNGVIFKIYGNGNNYSKLYTFNGINGITPKGNLIQISKENFMD